ncbi:Dihydroneopterin aldolase-domain-containing protein [Xylariaceae sp. FL1651]|nr:Dihydroneopterin aldolase-domain-containing protein [Xylariaceae sp. FL1651]
MLSNLWKSPPNAKGVDPDPDPPAPLVSTWQVHAEAGEPQAVVRVRNLQSVMAAGRDAWGRSARPQPVLLSSEVSFAAPFATASARDALSAETVHYGTLCKTLLGGMELFSSVKPPSSSPPSGNSGGKAVAAAGNANTEQQQQQQKEKKEEEGDNGTTPPRTADVVELLWVQMTGRVLDGSRVALPPDQVPFLDATRLRSLALTLRLPKASLLGSGVSLTTTACFRAVEGEKKDNPLRSYARSLRLHGLHVPTLVGVNANERRAKQMVVADVEIDRYDVAEDIHAELERVVVDTMEASSFETLEALGTHLANTILGEFRIGNSPQAMRERGWRVRVCLEKPIAVPFADCPSVEIRMGP